MHSGHAAVFINPRFGFDATRGEFDCRVVGRVRRRPSDPPRGTSRVSPIRSHSARDMALHSDLALRRTLEASRLHGPMSWRTQDLQRAAVGLGHERWRFWPSKKAPSSAILTDFICGFRRGFWRARPRGRELGAKSPALGLHPIRRRTPPPTIPIVIVSAIRPATSGCPPHATPQAARARSRTTRAVALARSAAAARTSWTRAG